ncbi:MAG: S1 RNA-binding domain-containing protein [Gammaproteobacteria bacterium]|nr:S1 RNA-binding domain-containing protein [Gammaproteobacteria bacterium]
MANLRVGALIRGAEVIRVEDNVAYLGVGAKCDGTIYLDFFTNDKNVKSLKDVLKEGDRIDVEVSKVTSENVFLSRLSIEDREKRDKIIRKIMNRHPFQAEVLKATEDGLILEKDGVRLSCPNKLIDLDPNFDKNTLVGQTVKVLFAKTEQNERGKTQFIVSRKQVQYNEERAAREKEFNSINVDDVLEGTVERITEFGAFVKFNNVEGLVHLSEVSHYHLKSASEVLEVGQKVQVKVIKKTESKIQLSIKALEKSPWEKFLENHKVGDVVETKIVKKSENFMLCEIERDVVGILNKSDYSWKKDDNFAGTVEEGDMVSLQIIYIDKEKNRMTLSKKHLEYNPWQDAHFNVKEIVTGQVLRFTNTGAIVKVGNVEAFIPDRDASQTAKTAQEVLKVGDVINAQVIKVDPGKWYLQLSIRAIEEAKEREYVDKYINENVSSSISIEDALKEKE